MSRWNIRNAAFLENSIFEWIYSSRKYTLQTIIQCSSNISQGEKANCQLLACYSTCLALLDDLCKCIVSPNIREVLDSSVLLPDGVSEPSWEPELFCPLLPPCPWEAPVSFLWLGDLKKNWETSNIMRKNWFKSL